MMRPDLVLWQVWQHSSHKNLNEIAALDLNEETGQVQAVFLRSIRADSADEPPGNRHIRQNHRGNNLAVGKTRRVELVTLFRRYRFVNEALPDQANN